MVSLLTLPLIICPSSMKVTLVLIWVRDVSEYGLDRGQEPYRKIVVHVHACCFAGHVGSEDIGFAGDSEPL